MSAALCYHVLADGPQCRVTAAAHDGPWEFWLPTSHPSLLQPLPLLSTLVLYLKEGGLIRLSFFLLQDVKFDPTRQLRTSQMCVCVGLSRQYTSLWANFTTALHKIPKWLDNRTAPRPERQAEKSGRLILFFSGAFPGGRCARHKPGGIKKALANMVNFNWTEPFAEQVGRFQTTTCVPGLQMSPFVMS